MRKTFSVNELRIRVNTMLATSIGGTAGKHRREGMQNILEQILMDADQYRGFRYLSANEVPPGELPGIVRQENGQPVVPFESPDESRVEYYG